MFESTQRGVVRQFGSIANVSFPPILADRYIPHSAYFDRLTLCGRPSSNDRIRSSPAWQLSDSFVLIADGSRRSAAISSSRNENPFSALFRHWHTDAERTFRKLFARLEVVPDLDHMAGDNTVRQVVLVRPGDGECVPAEKPGCPGSFFQGYRTDPKGPPPISKAAGCTRLDGRSGCCSREAGAVITFSQASRA